MSEARSEGIKVSINIRNLCVSGDSRDISISIIASSYANACIREDMVANKRSQIKAESLLMITLMLTLLTY